MEIDDLFTVGLNREEIISQFAKLTAIIAISQLAIIQTNVYKMLFVAIVFENYGIIIVAIS